MTYLIFKDRKLELSENFSSEDIKFSTDKKSLVELEKTFSNNFFIIDYRSVNSSNNWNNLKNYLKKFLSKDEIFQFILKIFKPENYDNFYLDKWKNLINEKDISIYISNIIQKRNNEIILDDDVDISNDESIEKMEIINNHHSNKILSSVNMDDISTIVSNLGVKIDISEIIEKDDDIKKSIPYIVKSEINKLFPKSKSINDYKNVLESKDFNLDKLKEIANLETYVVLSGDNFTFYNENEKSYIKVEGENAKLNSQINIDDDIFIIYKGEKKYFKIIKPITNNLAQISSVEDSSITEIVTLSVKYEKYYDKLNDLLDKTNNFIKNPKKSKLAKFIMDDLLSIKNVTKYDNLGKTLVEKDNLIIGNMEIIDEKTVKIEKYKSSKEPKESKINNLLEKIKDLKSELLVVSKKKILRVWQKNAINYIENGHSILINGPTGGGKTYVSMIAFNYFIENKNVDKILYVAPNYHLAFQTYCNFRKTFPNEPCNFISNVNNITSLKNNVFIGTPLELWIYVLTNNITFETAIFDEIHTISRSFGDDKLSEINSEALSNLLGRTSSQLIALSATINEDDNVLLRNYLSERSGIDIINKVSYYTRPVKLERYVMKNSILEKLDNKSFEERLEDTVIENIKFKEKVILKKKEKEEINEEDFLFQEKENHLLKAIKINEDKKKDLIENEELDDDWENALENNVDDKLSELEIERNKLEEKMKSLKKNRKKLRIKTSGFKKNDLRDFNKELIDENNKNAFPIEEVKTYSNNGILKEEIITKTIPITPEKTFNLLEKMEAEKMLPGIIFDNSDEDCFDNFKQYVRWIENEDLIHLNVWYELQEKLAIKISKFNNDSKRINAKDSLDSALSSKSSQRTSKTGDTKDLVSEALNKVSPFYKIKSDLILEVINEIKNVIDKLNKKDDEDKYFVNVDENSIYIKYTDKDKISYNLASCIEEYVKYKKIFTDNSNASDSDKISSLTYPFDGISHFFRIGNKLPVVKDFKNIRKESTNKESNVYKLLEAENLKEKTITKLLDLIIKGLEYGVSIIIPTFPFIIQYYILKTLTDSVKSINNNEKASDSIKCLFAARSMAMGINFAYRTVVIRSMKYMFMNVAIFMQMEGRGGRQGLDNRANVISWNISNAEETTIKHLPRIFLPDYGDNKGGLINNPLPLAVLVDTDRINSKNNDISNKIITLITSLVHSSILNYDNEIFDGIKVRINNFLKGGGLIEKTESDTYIWVQRINNIKSILYELYSRFYNRNNKEFLDYIEIVYKKLHIFQYEQF